MNMLTLFAAIPSPEGLLLMLVYLFVVALILGLLLYAMGKVPPLAPFMPVLQVVFIIIFVLVIVYFLLGLLR